MLAKKSLMLVSFFWFAQILHTPARASCVSVLDRVSNAQLNHYADLLRELGKKLIDKPTKELLMLSTHFQKLSYDQQLEIFQAVQADVRLDLLTSQETEARIAEDLEHIAQVALRFDLAAQAAYFLRLSSFFTSDREVQAVRLAATADALSQAYDHDLQFKREMLKRDPLAHSEDLEFVPAAAAQLLETAIAQLRKLAEYNLQKAITDGINGAPSYLAYERCQNEASSIEAVLKNQVGRR